MQIDLLDWNAILASKLKPDEIHGSDGVHLTAAAYEAIADATAAYVLQQ